MVELLAAISSGAYFGAALYITVAQHPATLEAGAAFASRFFPAMYRRTAPMQVALALISSLAGLWAWWRGSGLVWLAGALLLLSVIPLTLVLIRPVTQQLLAPGRDSEAPDTESLLRRWGSLHVLRTVLSGLAFVLVLAALASG